ncbi:MAG TPA: nucleotidyltransferase domain-containing protein [Candidatus Saccharimonadales bacterium]|nr:nucleotidyltransferase domain-containing protein [Candidatus Saccharimonadales bacterium]
MARILTPEEISQGHIPDSSAPYHAARYIVEHAIIEGESYGVASGMVFGSVAMGTADRLSDVDVLFTYGSTQARTALPLIGRVIRKASVQYDVPIEELAYAEGTLTPRHRGIDPFLAGHWAEIERRYPEQWCFRSPLKDWVYDVSASGEQADGVRTIILRYLTTKMDIYGYGMMKQDRPDYRKMQKALELPRSLGRKMLALINADDDFHMRASFEKDWTQSETRRWLASLGAPARPALVQFDHLIHSRAYYDECLTDVLEGAISVEQYGGWLRDNYFSCCSAAYGVCSFCRALLEAPEEDA